MRADVVSAAEAKGKPPTPDQLDRVDEYPRAEAREFLAQPQIVTRGPADKPAFDAAQPPPTN